MFLCVKVEEREGRETLKGVGGSRAPSQKRLGVATQAKQEKCDCSAGRKSRSVESGVAACSQSEITALKVKRGVCQPSLTLDTGAAVNVQSGKTFKGLKRISRGGRY